MNKFSHKKYKHTNTQKIHDMNALNLLFINNIQYVYFFIALSYNGSNTHSVTQTETQITEIKQYLFKIFNKLEKDIDCR